MSEAELLFPRQRYTCIQCGQSCGQWRILVEPERVESLRRHPLALELRVAGQDCLEPVRDASPALEGWYQLRYDAQERCYFLRTDKLCAVHADQGWEAKPRPCRQFPFFLNDTPDGVQVGLSFRCTAVLEDQGVDWQQHRGDLQSLYEGAQYPRLGFEPVQLGAYRLDWQTYKGWEASWLERPASLSEVVYATLAPCMDLQMLDFEWASLIEQLSQAALGFLEGCAPMEVARAFYCQDSFYGRRQARDWPATSLAPQEQPLLRRYLDHILERKTLWSSKNWLGRLLMVLVAERLVSYYGPLLGWTEAVKRIEGEWLAHRDDLDEIEENFGQALT